MNTGVRAGAFLRGVGALFRVVSWADARDRPGNLVGVLLCVALGVSAMVASGNLVASTVEGISKSWQVASSQGDLRIANGFAGVSESLIPEIAAEPQVQTATGILTSVGTASLAGADVQLTLVAFDLLGSDAIHRRALGSETATVPDETPFLSRIDAALFERRFAERHAFEIGDEIPIELESGRKQLYVAGLVEPNEISALFGGAVAVLDLPAAQVLLDRRGIVEAIDIELVPGSITGDVLTKLEAKVHGQATVSESGTSDQYASLIRNFRLTLGVPAVMAIVVGSLVIYQAVMIAVSRRRPLMNVVRSLGATPGMLFLLFAIEGLFVGIVGSLLGLGLGWGLSHAASGIVLETISTVYRPLSSYEVYTHWPHALFSCGIAIAICVLSYVLPSRYEIDLSSPLLSSSPGRARWREARARAVVGGVLVLVGIAVGSFPGRQIQGEQLAYVVTAGDALALLGFGLSIPVLLLSMATRIKKVLARIGWPSLRLAWQGIALDPARSGVVVTSILIGSAYIMVTVGPIGSLSREIVQWVSQSQTADLIVAAPGSIGFFPTARTVPESVVDAVREIDGVERVEPIRLLAQPYGDRWVVLAGRDPAAIGIVSDVEVVDGDLDRGRRAIRLGTGTIVSAHLAEQHGLGVGDSLSLRSPTGSVSLKIETIVTDFASADLGTAFIAPETLQKHWRSSGASAIQVWLGSTSNLSAERVRVREALGQVCNCTVLTRSEYVDRSAGIVNAVFYMAYALEVVAVIVMFFAVLLFFRMALKERERYYKSLRAIGATQSQIWRSVVSEAAMIGFMGSFLGCGIGYLLAMRMALTTMRVGGGFELDFSISPQVIFFTMAGAVVLCCAAASAQSRRIGLTAASPPVD